MSDNLKALTKTQFVSELTTKSGVSKQQVEEVLDALNVIVGQQLGQTGPGTVTLPGLLKIVRVDKAAQPAKIGVPNPFKPGETMDVAAKPASSNVKVRPLKALKDMV